MHSSIEVESVKDIVLLKCLQNPFRFPLIFESIIDGEDHALWTLYPPLKDGMLLTLLFCKGKSKNKPFLSYNTLKDEIHFCDGVENSVDIFFPVLRCTGSFEDGLKELCPRKKSTKHIPLWKDEKSETFMRSAYFTSIVGKERNSCAVFRWKGMLVHAYLVNSTYGEWIPFVFTAPDRFEGRNLIGYKCEPVEEVEPISSVGDRYHYSIAILNVKQSENTIFDSLVQW